MILNFTKMHGFGNDFIIIDNRELKYDLEWSEIASTICHRRFSIGGDGLIILEKSSLADVKWLIFNPDGTVVEEKCGNGLACIGRYFFNNIEKKKLIKIESKLGIIEVKVNEDNIKIDMGKVELDEKLKGKIKIILDKTAIEGYFILLGNPHFVFFVDDLDENLFYEVAPNLEKNKMFPKGANIHMASIKDGENISMLSWERNIGPTLSCGSGACSVLFAASKEMMTNNAYVESLAGTYLIKLRGNEIQMISNAFETFKGYINI